MARAAQAEAAATRDDALAAARSLRSRLEVTELALQRAHADAETRSHAVDEFGATVREVALRAEGAEAAASMARAERDAAVRRAASCEREAARAASAAQEVQRGVDAAETGRSAAEARAKETGAALADTAARLEACERAAEATAARAGALEAALSAEREGRVAAEAEVLRQRDELARRPPLDVLRSLDIDGLLSRNLQAAAAMQSLLAFSGQVSSTGVGAGAGPAHGGDK